MSIPILKTEIARRLGWSRQRLDYYLNNPKKTTPVPIEVAMKIAEASEGQITIESLVPGAKSLTKQLIREVL